MKAYRGVDGKIRLFRPNMNMNRMNVSAHRSGLPTFDGEELVKCVTRLISIDQEWVPHTEASSLYIRPTLIGIDPTLGVASSESALLYAILSPVGEYFKADKSGGISLLADPRYTRFVLNSILLNEFHLHISNTQTGKMSSSFLLPGLEYLGR